LSSTGVLSAGARVDMCRLAFFASGRVGPERTALNLVGSIRGGLTMATIMSAMRYEFGGHQERGTTRNGGA